MAPTLWPNSFAVLDDKLGVLIYGSVPLDYMVPLLDATKKRLGGKKVIIHPGISWTCDAMMAVTTEKLAPIWMKSMGIGPDNPDWLKSCDIGTSSLTIYSVLHDDGDVNTLRGAKPCTPRDADDFGRCYRLLERFPEWRDRLGDVVAKYEEWAPIVGRWAKLSALYEAKLWPELNKLLAEP